MDSPNNDRDESAVIDAILKGNTALFNQLIRPHERLAYRVAFSYLKNEAEAEDAVQEAVLRAYCNLSKFRAEAKFSTWLITIVLNEARARIRQRSNHRFESINRVWAEGTICELFRDKREVPLEALVRKETWELLENALNSLPEGYRRVFVLREMEGFTSDMTAEALSISIPSVKVRLHRARIMLKDRLTPFLKPESANAT